MHMYIYIWLRGASKGRGERERKKSRAHAKQSCHDETREPNVTSTKNKAGHEKPRRGQKVMLDAYQD